MHQPELDFSGDEPSWILEKEDLFTALLLELGPPLPPMAARVSEYFDRVVEALQKYEVPDTVYFLSKYRMAHDFIGWARQLP